MGMRLRNRFRIFNSEELMSQERRHMYIGIDRTLCDVLDEMRKADQTKNYCGLLGLIEEVQRYGNRMESALSEHKSLHEISEQKALYKKEIRDLEAKLDKLDSGIKEAELKIKELTSKKIQMCMVDGCENEVCLNSQFCTKCLTLIQK